MTSVVDFTNSYLTFFGSNEGNIVRCQLDAACTLYDDAAGTAQTFYLIVPCRAEDMYLDTALFKMPNYEFCGIWSDDEFLIIRTLWESDRERRQFGVNRESFADVRLDVRRYEGAAPLPAVEDIVATTLANVHMVARTELRDEAHGLHAVLEYPMKTINVMRRPPRFQVDTGPIIVPNVETDAARAIERFDMAYAVYNTFDRAEFILRRPVPIGGTPEKASTTDYSVASHWPARNQLFRVG
jgi:hypothetical protein